MDLLARLKKLKLLVVTGKGGVGKSTLTVALGEILSAAGKRVLLLETDPRESLYPLLDVPPTGGEPRRVRHNLYVQNLRPRDVLDELVRQKLWVDFLVQRVVDSPVYQQFAEGAPGLKELAILGQAYRIVHGEASSGAPDVDLVVLDAPASGHGVSMLAAPLLVAEVISEGPFGQMGAEIASFIADAEQSGVVVVTLAEEMPVRETIEFVEALRERTARTPELLVVNGLYPAADGPQSGQAAGGDLEQLWRRRRAVNERELSRLSENWSGPRVELPLLPLDRGPELVRAIATRVTVGLSHPAERKPS